MEKTLRERQQDEALKRMAILKLLPNVIEEFKTGVVYYSERQNAVFDGVLYWVSNDEEYEKARKCAQCRDSGDGQRRDVLFLLHVENAEKIDGKYGVRDGIDAGHPQEEGILEGAGSLGHLLHDQTCQGDML